MAPDLIAHLVAPLVAVVGELLSILDAVWSIACKMAGGRPMPRHGPCSHAGPFTHPGSLSGSRSWRRGPLTGTRPIL
jgi:hypothetical protein